ncbi:flavin-binding monooxygenase-like protein [Lepidopterella palustris CBS 459.81]|uniref:Flavin-binding monooxygenase-like protein n=1 Tax=Lepidopterella palustris CBS 459.81 TaxID=1314670 RepID=A0A8E2JEX3_9PEZI|nr:flavin-binding monooxygenase-like protein [Lepidopterella palustris CBS 459.81]
MPTASILPQYRGLPPHTNAQGYTVPDITFRDPSNRKIRVVTIGAGYSGILLAYKLQKETQNVEHVIYEKNGEIGGAWLENRYPNCACDVPAHSYVYDFALNPHWPELFSKADHIWKYLDRVCRAFGLRKYMKFNHKITEAIWNEEKGKWALTIEKTYADDSVEVLHDECDVLLQAAGVLNNPITPHIDGMESFKGKIIHTASWPDDFGPEQWKGRRVAVIGAGSSSVQCTPGMQPYVDHLDIFIRSKTWLSLPSESIIPVLKFSAEQQKLYETDMNALVNQARQFEVIVNSRWSSMFKSRKEQEFIFSKSKENMEYALGEQRLIDNLVPDFGVGCRRTSPGYSFMEALKQPNVSVHFTPVVRITPDGPVGADGTTTKVDTLITATGFDTSFRPHFRLIGQNGISLADKFTPNPDGYLGVSCPGFPNYLTFFGPAWPIFDGSITQSLSAVADLAVQLIRKIQEEDIRSISPRQDVTDAFNDHTQTMLRGTVWEDTCSGWYHNKQGRVTAIWPGSALHFQQVIRQPRWEDYNIKYMNPHNMWAFMGLGFTKSDKDPKADKAPYLKVEKLDPGFYDYEKVPDYEGPAPTKEQAKRLTAEKRGANGATNGHVNGNDAATAADAAGFAENEVGHIEGPDAELNFRIEIPVEH